MSIKCTRPAGAHKTALVQEPGSKLGLNELCGDTTTDQREFEKADGPRASSGSLLAALGHS